jgi:O-antigen/teichoic acid export membrane protein
VVPLFGIIMLPFLWQKITPSDYGLITIAGLIMAFGTPFVGLRQEAALSRLYFEWSHQCRSQNISTLFILNFLSILVFGTIIVFLFYKFGSKFLPVEASNKLNVIAIFLISLILVNNRGMMNSYLRISSRAVEFFFYNFLIIIIQGLFITKFVFIDDLRVLGYAFSLLFAECSILLFTLFYFFLRTGYSFQSSTAIASLKYSIPLMPATIFSSSSTIIERVVLLSFLPLSIVGIYENCQKVSSVVLKANNTLKMIFVPKAFEMVCDSDLPRKVLARYRNNFFFVIVLCSIVALPIMDIITVFSASVEYQSAGSYFPVFIVFGVISSAATYFCSGPTFSKKTYLTNFSPFVEMIVLSSLSFYLVKYLGLSGVLLSKLIAAILSFLLAFKISQKSYYIPFILDKKLKYIMTIFTVLFILQIIF